MAGAAQISATFWILSAISPARPSFAWNRITAPPKPSSKPPAPWWRTTPSASAKRCAQNYRSTQTILEAASAVVAHNTERIGKTLWTDSGAGEKITLYEAPDSENEALWIADTVE